MKRSFILHTLVFLAVFVVQGCSSTGGAVSKAALAGDPVAMAEDGARLNSRGAELVKRGEERLVKARVLVREGEAMVGNGSTLVANARSEYRELSQATGQALSPEALDVEARRLLQIGDRWEEAIETVREGNLLVDRGNRNIGRAQADIQSGRQMMEQGSTLVRNSERMRLNEALIPTAN